MHLRITSSRGWKARQDAAKAKALSQAENRADPVKALITKTRNAHMIIDRARDEVMTAEDLVARVKDRLRVVKTILEGYEDYALQHGRVHTSLFSGQNEVKATEALLTTASQQLAAAKAKLLTAEAQLAASQGQPVAAMPVPVAPVEPVPVAIVELTANPPAAPAVSRVPARVDSGVALDLDAALAELEPVKRGRRR